MPELVTGLSLLINVFDKYAKKEGDSNTLTKGELKDLLQNEFGELVGNAPDKEAVDKIFHDLDINKDNSVDFEEYGRLAFCFASLCYNQLNLKK